MVSIEAVTFEHHPDGFGIGHDKPRITIRYASGPEKDWKQTAVEIEVTREGKSQSFVTKTAQSTLLPWPSTPLLPRERAQIRVRAFGPDNDATAWASADVEASLLDAKWSADLISASEISDPAKAKPPIQFTSTFQLTSSPTKARLYATAYGIYEVTINGQRVGDQVLAPGWTVYNERLRYQTYDVTDHLQPGDNVITAQVGEGWYAGRLGNKGGNRNLWGDRLAFLAQVEVGGQVVAKTDPKWEWTFTPTTRGEIYDGEDFDSRQVAKIGRHGTVDILPFPTASLVSADSPPVRKILEIKAKEVITSPSGKTILDFGQNLVGWLRCNSDIPGEGQIVIRHAEVLEDGELGVRPLRDALATDRITLGGSIAGWEPKFTFHGFRYAEVTGVPNLGTDTFTAIVISSDLRRTGKFECSHSMINRLHQNVVWSMLGNFVSVPTDCPQRDERLGWTGDIQVFAPTANYLYDTSAFLSDWLLDLASEQAKHNGIPPFVIPDVPMRNPHKAFPHSVWADVTALLPRDLYTSFGDETVLARQFDSMTDWLDRGIPRQADGLWDPEYPQFADWLDPRAPPEYPAHGLTDTHFVANAYLVHTTQVVAQVAKLLGKEEAHAKYHQDAERLLGLWRAEYLSSTGRTVSDSQTALALALHFDLVRGAERHHAAERLNHLVRWWSFKITTGFAGTPILLDTLARTGHLGTAYRMLQEKDVPSWLYPVGMGATTVWERWDSMLPDGKINPGQMTSFNHYALGAVAAFLHKTVGGLSPHSPGWKTALVKPRPGGTITSASTSYSSPYGTYSVSWVVKHGQLTVDIQVPPNGSAVVDLPRSKPISVGSGVWSWTIDWNNDDSWPPKQLPGPSRVMMPDVYVP